MCKIYIASILTYWFLWVLNRNSVASEIEIKTAMKEHESKSFPANSKDNNANKPQVKAVNEGKKSPSSNDMKKMSSNSNDQNHNRKAEKNKNESQKKNEKSISKDKPHKLNHEVKPVNTKSIGDQKIIEVSTKSLHPSPTIDDQYIILSSEIADAVENSQS